MKHTVQPDGQPPTVAFTVLAQLCSPKANKTRMGAALFTKNGKGRNLILTVLKKSCLLADMMTEALPKPSLHFRDLKIVLVWNRLIEKICLGVLELRLEIIITIIIIIITRAIKSRGMWDGGPGPGPLRGPQNFYKKMVLGVLEIYWDPLL